MNTNVFQSLIKIKSIQVCLKAVENWTEKSLDMANETDTDMEHDVKSKYEQFHW